MADKKQRLVLSILDFLTESMVDGTVKEEDKEGLEVAAQSIGEAFGVDPADAQQRQQLSVKPANLQSIFDVFLKTRDRVSTEASPLSAKSQPSAEDKAQAEKFKQAGNAQMSRKEFAQAIQAYTDAIALDSTNPVYYSNRAAAHSSTGDHQKAVDDAEMAIATDPKFVKAFSRLGHAHYSLGDFTSASSAFERGLELEPGNANLKSGLEQAQARIRPDSPPELADEVQSAPRSGPGASGMPDLSGMADMLRGMGGGGAGAGAGAGGGMPDLSSLMSNPAVMQMAQSMMANGGMERLMQNPALSGMMNRVQSGGGMPSMQELMSDPSLRELAGAFGGAGAAPGAAPGGSPPP